MKLFIGCSSRNEIPSKYYDYCKDFLEQLFHEGYDLVFGACGKGLMGLAYDVATKNDREVVGIYPEVYRGEVEGLSCIEVPVRTVGERTNKVIQESDVLIFLPGGIGTLCELFTAIESKRAGEHDKPIIIYDCGNFYDNMMLQLDKMCDEKFTSISDEGCYFVCTSFSQVTNYLNNYSKNKNRMK